MRRSFRTWIINMHGFRRRISAHVAKRINFRSRTLQPVIFLGSRFICTFLLKFLNAGLLLGLLAVGGCLLTLGAVFIQGMPGLYCLIGVSACMSLMFPTIYGIALNGLSPNDAKLGSAGLIFAIVGGAFMPLWQGAVIDGPEMTIFGQTLESVRISFFLPAVCFVVVALYGFVTSRRTSPVA